MLSMLLLASPLSVVNDFQFVPSKTDTPPFVPSQILPLLSQAIACTKLSTSPSSVVYTSQFSSVLSPLCLAAPMSVPNHFDPSGAIITLYTLSEGRIIGTHCA